MKSDVLFNVYSLPFDKGKCFFEDKCEDADTLLCPRYSSWNMEYVDNLDKLPKDGIDRTAWKCRYLKSN